jgi:hypothetical protein
MVAPVFRRLTGGWPPSDPHADLPIRMPAPPPRAPARIPRVLQGASLLRHPARPWPPIFVRRGFPASFRAPPCQALRPPVTRVSSAATTTRPTPKITRGPSIPHARPTTPPTLGRFTSCAGLPSPSQRGGAGGEDPGGRGRGPLRALRGSLFSPSPPCPPYPHCEPPSLPPNPLHHCPTTQYRRSHQGVACSLLSVPRACESWRGPPRPSPIYPKTRSNPR